MKVTMSEIRGESGLTERVCGTNTEKQKAEKRNGFKRFIQKI